MEGGAAEVAEGKDETLPKSQGYADSEEAQQQHEAAEMPPEQSPAPENFSPDVAQFNT